MPQQYDCAPDCNVHAKPQAVVAIAKRKWGSFEGLKQQRADTVSRNLQP